MSIDESFRKLADKLRKRLFGSSEEGSHDVEKRQISYSSLQPIDEEPATSNVNLSDVDPVSIDSHASINDTSNPEVVERDPYFLQIGFDYGTAYSKCVVRNVGLDTAKVFIEESPVLPESPFLIPSVVKLNEGKLSLIKRGDSFYGTGNLTLLKMALANFSEGKLDDYSLESFTNAIKGLQIELGDLIRLTNFFFLSNSFKKIDGSLRDTYTDFGASPDDRIYINIAIPVARMENKSVFSAFEEVIEQAWEMRQNVSDSMALAEVIEVSNDTKTQYYDEYDVPWYLYPEISANIQGYVRSRTSKPGLYLFSDTGAGTVDQAVFSYSKRNGDKLAYLSAQVLPWGSSNIEKIAYQLQPVANQNSREDFKKRKESGSSDRMLNQARSQIFQELRKWTTPVVARAKVEKLSVKSQIEKIELLFAGGGHTENPYGSGVKKMFINNNIFKKDLFPPAVGLPFPSDLEMPGDELKPDWLKRLSVAYGLSYPRYDLAMFVLPEDVPQARKLQSNSKVREYISKDMI